MASTGDSLHTRSVLEVGGTKFLIHRLEALGARAARLPFSLKILLENLLRGEDGRRVTREHIEALLAWEPARPSEREIPFMPARVLLQDFTGVPAVVDLAAMRDAMRTMGGDPARINPLQPADLEIAHPDTVLGTDSHTTMINGLGVVGWGVGGIEAEAAMLGQPTVMLVPEVVGFRLAGRLAPGATATDVVLTVTEMLRKKGVVGKFVEFYGPGGAGLALAEDRKSGV